MVKVTALIWDTWNKKHIAKHCIVPEEIEEVCLGVHRVKESFRKRLLVIGETRLKRKLIIVLSPEDYQQQSYGDGKYYVITAFDAEKEQYENSKK